MVQGVIMVNIKVDTRTAQALDFAANIAGITPGEVVARLVKQNSLPPSDDKTALTAPDGKVPIHADYEGFRNNALFDPATERVDFVEGPLAGQSFKSPSGAAVAVVKHHNPDVDPNRNGWSFWTVSETGEWLQSLRNKK
jgi:hypothetical protein